MDDFWIVSTGGLEQGLMHVTNRNTLAFETLDSGEPLAVWGAARDNVYVVGYGGTIRRYDGTSWQVVRTGGLPLSCIHGADANRIFAAGPSGSYVQFDGQWKGGSIGAGVSGIWVGNADALAVGDSRTLVRFDGTDWSPVIFDQSFTATPALFGVWGAADTYLAVGDMGKLAQSTDALRWGAPSPSSLGQGKLVAIDGTDSKNIFVVGIGGAIWQYSGAD